MKNFLKGSIIIGSIFLTDYFFIGNRFGSNNWVTRHYNNDEFYRAKHQFM